MPTLREQIDTPLGSTRPSRSSPTSPIRCTGTPASRRRNGSTPAPSGVGARYRWAVQCAAALRRWSTGSPCSNRPPRGPRRRGLGRRGGRRDPFTPRGTGTQIDYVADIRLEGVMRLAQPSRAARSRGLRGRAGRHAAGARRARRREGGRDHGSTHVMSPVRSRVIRIAAIRRRATEGGRWIKHVAVVGSGVSGLTAAYALRQRTAFACSSGRRRRRPRQDRGGGDADGIVPVDTGFIVYNEKTYPRFTGLLARTGRRDAADRHVAGLACRACGSSSARAGRAVLRRQRCASGPRMAPPRRPLPLLSATRAR